MEKPLSALLAAIEHTCVRADGTPADGLSGDTGISSLAFDSRDVTAGALFFALPGTHTTGNKFIPAALMAGAAAVVFQDEWDETTKSAITAALDVRGEDVPLIRVADARFVMAPVSAAFYDWPSKKLVVIGVTGTEGKSSTVSFIWQLLRRCGKKAGFISTVEYSLGGEAIANPQHQTTPEAPVIQRQLAQMLAAGCEYAVVESSSHGLSARTNRTGCIDYDCAVFMNVTLEHLEFHKTFAQYRDDKANLFRKLDECNHRKVIGGRETTVRTFGIVNLEDESAPYFAAATAHPVFGFTTGGTAGRQTGKPLPPIPGDMPYLAARDITAMHNDLRFTVSGRQGLDGGELTITAPTPGAFNAYNIMAAMLAVSRLTDTPLDEIVPHTGRLIPILGRMTVIDHRQPFEVIVDYAHTPSSFETIFPPIRKRCAGKMLCVFGSGGERDTEKRPLQGEIAARFCDVIILADEDPRGEDPAELLAQIAAGAEKAGKVRGKDLLIIPDRPTAIRRALSLAGTGDIVLLLGKAHENSIIYKDHIMPYDEISEAEHALGEMGY
ncbi:MAG: UDP-N-acetylmuramyl-tripeptide synthetase [Treponemataceae bacterium]|nr:UDP-N-acetylmuramyl-tripeptide synthetase [Treponemataceae bacterium]